MPALLFKMLMLILIIPFQSSSVLPPTVYGMISGSTQTYDNTSISTYNTSIKVTYPYIFKITPEFAYYYSNYRDESTHNRTHYAIKTDSSITSSQTIIRFAYTSDGTTYPVILRIRYLAWDNTIYNTIQSFNSNFEIANGVPTDTAYIQYKQSFPSVPKMYCFIKGLLNFAPEANTAILFSCNPQYTNSTHFLVSIQTSHKNYNTSAIRSILTSYLIVFQSDKYSLIDGSLVSTSGSLAFHTHQTDLPNSHYIIGTGNFYKMGRAIQMMLLDNDTKIDNSFTYFGITFCYYIITLVGDTSGINIAKVSISTTDNIVLIKYQNVSVPQNKTVNNFKISNNNLNISKLLENTGSEMILEVKYNIQQNLNDKSNVSYTWDHGTQYSIISQMEIVWVEEITMDLISSTLEIKIVNAPKSSSITSSDYSISNISTENSFQASSDSILLNVSLPDTVFRERYVMYLETIREFEFEITMKMLRIKVVQVILREQCIKITFEGFDNPHQVSFSHFSISSTLVSPGTVSVNNGNIVLTLNGRVSELLHGMEIGYNFPATPHKFRILNTKIFSVVVTKIQSTGFNNFIIEFENPFNKSINLSEISCLPSYVTPLSVNIDPVTNHITVEASFSETIEGRLISFIYYSSSDAYQQMITVPIISDIPLIYWEAGDLKIYRYSLQICEALQYIYLTIFFFSLITVKIPGVETISLIQLAYYSFIPIGVYRSSVFMGFVALRYVSGWNPFFSSSSTTVISNNYSLLNLRSNFVSNVNLMVGIILICPVIYLILLSLSYFSNDYKLKPRLQKWSKSFLLQFPLTLFMFNSYNICISFVINSQSVKTQDIVSFCLSVGCLIMPLSIVIIMMIFQKHFSEFHQEINKTNLILKLSMQTSIKIRMMYPLVLYLQITIIPILLSIKELFDVSLYAILPIILLVSIYAIIAMPYLHKVDNIRLLIHRFLLIFLISFQILAHQTLSQQDSRSLRYSYPWIIILILVLGIIFNGSYIFWKIWLWARKPGIIDMKMFVQQKGTTNKTLPVDYVPAPEGPSFPKLEYGVGFIHKKKRDKLETCKNDKERNRLLKELKISVYFNELTEGMVPNEP